MFPRVCVCMYVLDVCLQKKTEIEFALFKQNASFWTVFVLLLFLFCFILSYCFFWSQDSSLPQVQDSESGLKKCLQKASKLSLRIFLTLIFNHCPRRTSTCGGTLVKRFFFCFLLFLTFCSILILFCWVFVFFFFTCCKLRSLSYTPSLLLLLLLLLPSPLPASCFV